MFDERKFLNYAKNVFIKILYSIMNDKIDEIDSYVGENVYLDLSQESLILSDNEEKQIYEMPNVKSASILTRYEANGFSIIEVKLIVSYVDYVININTDEVIDGDKKTRGDHEYILYFYKNLNAQELSEDIVCPSCGKPLEETDNGKCSYCDTSYNLEDFLYMLDRVDKNS